MNSSMKILQLPIKVLQQRIDLELTFLKIIDEEDKSNPLNDDALVEALAKKGYTLTLRAVTKLRKEMNIPSSRQRWEY